MTLHPDLYFALLDIGDITTPGAMQLTLMFLGASSRARDFDPAINAPFVKLYNVLPTSPTAPITADLDLENP